LFFIKIFDLAKILLPSLEGMGRGILEMLACLPLDGFLVDMLFVEVLLNYTDTHCLKDLLSLLAVSLSQSDS